MALGGFQWPTSGKRGEREDPVQGDPRDSLHSCVEGGDGEEALQAQRQVSIAQRADTHLGALYNT